MRDGPAKLLEYNADTPTSIFEAAVFQWTWLEQAIERRKTSYVLRGLQPSEDRVALYESGVGFAKIRSVIEEMGRIVSWGQLRSSGRKGSAIADALIEFGSSRRAWSSCIDSFARVTLSWRIALLIFFNADLTESSFSYVLSIALSRTGTWLAATLASARARLTLALSASESKRTRV